MRKILTKDIFTLARIIKKANVKEELKKIDLKKAEVNEVGMTIIFTIVEAGAVAESEIYKLIEDITGKNIENMELKETIELIKELAKENDLIRFFKSATQ